MNLNRTPNQNIEVMKTQIFLLRHARYIEDFSKDPELSEIGRTQALTLARNIQRVLSPGTITIWTSTARRAQQTADIIHKQLPSASLEAKDKLWSDNSHKHDFTWLEQEIDSFTGDILIIVSHLEYVQDFPISLGHEGNDSSYAQGVLIRGGACCTVFNK